MINPPIEKLIDQIGGRFDLVIVASRRARDINNYYTQLGGGIGQYAPPQVLSQSQKPLSIALEEIAAGKVVAKVGEPPSSEDSLALSLSSATTQEEGDSKALVVGGDADAKDLVEKTPE